MIEGLSIRQATKNDIEFVIETIIESEKSGSQVVSSCKVFGLSEEKFKEILREVLAQDIEDYDYYLSGFIVAEKNGEYVGGLGSFFEGTETHSGIIKATILFQYLDKSKMKEIAKNTRIIKGITPAREAGTLQLEHGYVKEKYRRQGVFITLLKENIKRNLVRHTFPKVQGIIFKDNYKSYNAHLKFGYEVVDERKVDDPEVLNFFPYNTKLLLEFSGGKIAKL
ncbi:MAG: GNAT family N-acetyltransferase [Ignavibacteriaceae bacterium]